MLFAISTRPTVFSVVMRMPHNSCFSDRLYFAHFAVVCSIWNYFLLWCYLQLGVTYIFIPNLHHFLIFNHIFVPSRSFPPHVERWWGVHSCIFIFEISRQSVSSVEKLLHNAAKFSFTIGIIATICTEFFCSTRSNTFNENDFLLKLSFFHFIC